MSRNVVLVCIVITSFTLSASASLVHWPLAEGGNGHFYEVVSIPGGIVWTDANSLADQTGGHLATITSQEENDFVFGLIDDGLYWNDGLGPWLGGYQPQGSSEPDGGWRWITDEPFVYTNWTEGQPNEWLNNDENRITFGNAGHSPSWNDLPDAGTPEGKKVVAFVIEYGSTIYVDADASGNNDGSSWADAFNYLQDALAAASLGDNIRVAQGTYRPDQGSGIIAADRNATFQLKNGVALYGGFPAGGGDMEDRDPSAHQTVLSGDLSGNDGPDFANNDENSYHVVTGSGTDATAILDGFSIMAGNADHVWNNEPPYDLGIHYGGGMVNSFGSPTLANCTFIDNASHHGAGMANYSSSPNFADCVFENNSASITSTVHGYGGGMFNMENSHPTLTNCDFTQNSALVRGGAIRNNYSNATVMGCTFDNNSAESGGAVHSVDSNPVFENCVFSNNETDKGGGAMMNVRSVAMLTGCVFANNSASTSGGAMWNARSGKLVLKDCTFSSNHADEHGGAMWNERSQPILSDCTFSLNSVQKYDGGAIHNRWGSNMTATRCRFIANTALRGAGVFNKQSGPTLANCVFEGNRAVVSGGAVYSYNDNVAGSHIKLTNCTFVGNFAKGANGSAVICNSNDDAYPSRVDITGCILRDVGTEIRNEDGSTIVINYTNIRGGWEGPGIGNFDADPVFAEMGYWDDIFQTPGDTTDDVWVSGEYHVKSQGGRWDPAAETWVIDDITSPCIDAGSMASPVGPEPFPNGGVINMGAYGGTVEASKSWFGSEPCEIIVAGDINGDCEVNSKDLAIMAFHWLE